MGEGIRKIAIGGLAAVACAAVLGLVAGAGVAVAAEVGFATIEVANGDEPALTGGVWYPTAAPAPAGQAGAGAEAVAIGAPLAGDGLPLVVISHGGGGAFDGHADTAVALARAGFVVAAVDHAGDDYKDQSLVLKLWRRPVQLRRLVSFMLNDWPERGRLDAARVGAFGFSNGGFTVLVAAGGVPDLDKTAPYCQAHPDHDLCRALAEGGADPHLGADVPPGAWVADPRIRAIVVAAPAFGFAFAPDGLKTVAVPAQVWRAAEDRHQPDAWYDEAVRQALPRPPDYRVVAGANHYSFLTPCGPRLAARAPQICADPPGFDRAAFHQAFDAEVVRFFQANLR